jgi:ABC-type enterochelin transport system ATPase subunit
MKIFAAELDFPDKNIYLYFSGDESKTRENFDNALCLSIRNGHNDKIQVKDLIELQRFNYDRKHLMIEDRMRKEGFELLKPDIYTSCEF